MPEIDIRAHVVCGSVIGLDAIVQAAVQAVMNGIESTKDDLGAEMQVKIPEDTGRLLNDYLMNLASGGKIASQVEYAADVEESPGPFKKGTAIPQAAAKIASGARQVASMHLGNEGIKIGLQCKVE